MIVTVNPKSSAPTPPAALAAIAQIPPPLADVALIDAAAFAAAAGRSVSSLHDLVRRGEAPQPVIRGHRFTRWRLGDVRAYLIAEVERAVAESAASQRVSTSAKASAAASAARAAARRSPAAGEQA